MSTVVLGAFTAFLAWLAYGISAQQASSAYFDTAQTCAVYREQVLGLAREYGQSAQQIRVLLSQEQDFAAEDDPESGIEADCGSIDSVVEVARQWRGEPAQ